MADTPFVRDDLAKYKAEGCTLDRYPDDQRTFFAPRDDIHGLLVALLGSAQHSIVANMFRTLVPATRSQMARACHK